MSGAPETGRRDPRPWARELDRDGLERALWPHFPRPPRHLASDLAVALYREGALEREEVIERARLGRRRLGGVEAAVRLGPLLSLVRRARSEADGAERYVLAIRRLGGDALVEAVAIPRRAGLVLCISSQSGCALGCRFCATGLLGHRADLTAGEIVEEYAWALRAAGRRPTDAVFMGMGEPLLNYEAVIAAAYRLTSSLGAQISPRRISISTVGIPERVREHARTSHPFPLIFSLTSAIPEKRARLVPAAKRYPLDDLRDAILEYRARRRRNRRVTIACVAIPGHTMGEEDVDALGAFVEGLPATIDVIPLNPTVAPFSPPSWAEVKRFTTSLRRLRVPVKIRYSAGKSAAAGCGQLAADLLPAVSAGGHVDAPPGIFSDLWRPARYSYWPRA
ncbi:MAG: radical SAM protein [Planctomycetota bacterium]